MPRRQHYVWLRLLTLHPCPTLTVGVDVECDVDLGDAAGRGGDAGELKLAQQVVVLGAGALTLVHLRGEERGEEKHGKSALEARQDGGR